MAETAVFEAGGYRYLRHAFQYSGGVIALPGFTIERARFASPVTLADGFEAVEAHLRALGRPLTAFCACELRSPRQFTDQGFIDFNRHYVRTLERWGIFKDEENPVARSNVCPEFNPPAEPVIITGVSFPNLKRFQQWLAPAHFFRQLPGIPADAGSIAL